MLDQPSLPTKDDLQKLPLRAIVAYAVRSGRRVQPLYGEPIDELVETQIEIAWAMGERFCRGEPIDFDVVAAAIDKASCASAVCYAADAYDAATNAAWNVARIAAVHASYAALVGSGSDTSDAYIAIARTDYDRLLSLNLGTYPDPGQPIDPTETGPLGPLWPEGPPEW